MTPDEFCEFVRQTWPRPNWGDSELAGIHASLRRLGESWDRIVEELRAMRQADLDAVRPSWNKLKRKLSDATDRAPPDLQVYLVSQRHQMTRDGDAKLANDLTDANLYQRFIDAQTFPITHSTITGKAHPDPDGRRSSMARNERTMWRDRFLWDYKQRKVAAPEYLTA